MAWRYEVSVTAGDEEFGTSKGALGLLGIDMNQPRVLYCVQPRAVLVVLFVWRL